MKKESEPTEKQRRLPGGLQKKQAVGAAVLLCIAALLIGIVAVRGQLARYVDSDTKLAAVYMGQGETVSKSAERRHTLVIAVDELTGMIAPQSVQVRGDRIMSDLIYEPLGKLQTNGVLQPVLAKDVRVAEDGSTMDIFLYDRVKFSDGTPMTADHVAGSVAAMVYHAAIDSPYRNIAGAEDFRQDVAAGLAGVAVMDSQRVRITFERPSSRNLQILDTRVQKITVAEAGSGVNTIGTGPYCVGETPHPMQLVKNKQFRKKFGDIETVQFVYTSVYDLNDYLKKGQVDVFLYEGGGKAYEQLAEYPTYNMYEKPTDEIYYFGFNYHNPWNEKKEFRQAVAHAFQREDLVNQKLFPYLAENKTLSLETDQYSKRGEDSVLDYDPQQAKELLAKINPEHEKIRLRLPVLESSVIQTTVAEAFRKDMERVGISVIVQPLKKDAYVEALYYSGEFDICLTTMRIPMEFSGMNALTVNVDALPIGWEDPAFFEALNKLEDCYGTEQYAEQLTELNRQVNENVPVLPYGRGKMFLSVSADLSGYQADPYSELLDHIWQIKVKK